MALRLFGYGIYMLTKVFQPWFKGIGDFTSEPKSRIMVEDPTEAVCQELVDSLVDIKYKGHAV